MPGVLGGISMGECQGTHRGIGEKETGGGWQERQGNAG